LVIKRNRETKLLPRKQPTITCILFELLNSIGKSFKFIFAGAERAENRYAFVSWKQYGPSLKKCLLSERREMRASKNAVLGLGVESNQGPLSPELCVLPYALLHIHSIYYSDSNLYYIIRFSERCYQGIKRQREY